MKRKTIHVLIAFLVLSVGGCSSVGTTVHGLKGQYYLNKADYAGGRSAFVESLAERPDDPVLNYYMARFELGDDNPEDALPFIQRAVRMDPGNADYRFWEGVTWWALMQPDQEKAAYEKALSLKPDHVSANLYLAHNLFDRGQDAAALERYERVLRLSPDEPQAMFNRAVALERLGRTQDMKRALSDYLSRYADAPLARQGARMLNAADDFTWRNHVIGPRTVTLRSLTFLPGTATLTADDKDSLDTVGSILSAKPDLSVHVVTYVDGDKELARRRALAVREYVARVHSKVAPSRLAPSWFGQPEIMKKDGVVHTLDESVNIFTKVQ